MTEPQPSQEPRTDDDFNELFHAMSVDFELLGRAIQDPYIEAAAGNVQRYNEILALEPSISYDEAASIENDLDSHWSELIEEKVRVSGKVRVETDGFKGEFTLEDQEVLSKGFSVQGDMVGDEESGYRIEKPKVSHVFKIGRGVIDATAEGKAARRKVSAYADVESVYIEPGHVSVERAKAWLESNYPDLLEELNERIYNSDGDEAQSLLALKGIKLADYAPIDDDFTRECVLTYIRETIDLDHMVFYAAGVDGPYKVKYKNAESPEELDSLLKESVLAFAYGPYIECTISEEAVDEWGIIIELAVATPVKNESTVVIRAPIESLKAMQSIRHAYYGS